jgi:hypothetical protein
MIPHIDCYLMDLLMVNRMKKYMLTNVCGSYEPPDPHVSLDLQSIADREAKR